MADYNEERRSAPILANEIGLAALSEKYEVMPVYSYNLAKARRDQMVGFVQDIMKEGIDYGVVPGTDKPTLLKPGAEKLASFFGLTNRFIVNGKEEDWTGEFHGGEPFFYYWYKAQMWRGDMEIAEAEGSCNSRESKFRWRWVAESDVPSHWDKAALTKRGGLMSEFEFAIDKAETTGQYGKPMEYWDRFRRAIEEGTARRVKKQSRSGRQLDAWEIDCAMYRVPNEDISSQVNTIQKIAQKRALVAAILLAVNASEFFTQDMEDMELPEDSWRSAPRSSPDGTLRPQGSPTADQGTGSLDHGVPAHNTSEGSQDQTSSPQEQDNGIISRDAASDQAQVATRESPDLHGKSEEPVIQPSPEVKRPNRSKTTPSGDAEKIISEIQSVGEDIWGKSRDVQLAGWLHKTHRMRELKAPAGVLQGILDDLKAYRKGLRPVETDLTEVNDSVDNDPFESTGQPTARRR